MTYPDYDNWYQRRSILGDGGSVGDRKLCGRSPAGTHQDLKTGLNRIVIQLEEMIAKIDKNTAQHVVHMEEISRQYTADREQMRKQYLENKKKSDARWEALLKKMSKKDSKAAHNDTEVVDLDSCVEVVEKEEECADSDDTEVLNNDISTEIAVVQGEIVEPTIAITVAMAVNRDGGQNDFSVRKFQNRSDNGYGKSGGISICRPENPQRLYVWRSTVNSVAVEFLRFWKKGKKRRERGRRTPRSTKNIPMVFPVVLTIDSGHGGPVEVRRRRRRPLRHLRKQKRPARFGEGLGLILGLGFGIEEYSCGGAKHGGGRSSLDFMQVVGVFEIEELGANERRVGQEEYNFYDSYCSISIIRVRGKKVKSLIDDIRAVVIKPNWILFLLLGPLLHYNRRDNWPSVLFAMAGGIVLSIGNLSTQYAWALVGLSVVEVVSSSITVVIGTTLNYFLDDKINKADILFPGVACFLVAVILGSCVHSSNASDNKKKLGQLSSGCVVTSMDPEKGKDGTVEAAFGTAEFLIELENKRSIKVFNRSIWLGLVITFFAGACFSLFSPAFNLATNDQFHYLKKGVPHLVVYTAFFYFSVSCFVFAIVLNIIFLYRPILNLPKSSFKAYLADSNGRGWALLAGLLCGFGNGLQFMGGQAAGYAAADAVQALPLVSTFWAILLFGEYRKSSRRTYILLVSMLLMFMVAVGVLMASSGHRK